MTDSKKRRLSMLDGLAAAGAQTPVAEAPGPTNRALRSARDAVDGHRVWDLDPALISDMRVSDRLDPDDVDDLRDSIETSGQTVPILVRRDPSDADRYLLVYGRRRLEAIRTSDRVSKVRALVANLDDDAATRAQVSENMARRDLTFIEKALFARELVDSGFGTQTEVAEVLTVAKSAISMALSIVEQVGPDLARAIGPAPGIGRPRWDALAQAVQQTATEPDALVELAERTRIAAIAAPALHGTPVDEVDPSVAAFEAVSRTVTGPAPRAARKTGETRTIRIAGKRAATLRRSTSGLRLDVPTGGFAEWLEASADDILSELHARWSRATEEVNEISRKGTDKAKN